VGEQVAGIVALQFDHARGEVVGALAEVRQLVGVLKAILNTQRPRHMQVQVGVNAILLELVDEPVQAVKLLGIEVLVVRVGGVPDAAGAMEHVQVVEAHAVNAQGGHASGDARGQVLVREAVGEGHIGPQEPQPPARAIIEATVPPGHEAVRARRTGAVGGHIDQAVGGGIADDERKPPLRRLRVRRHRRHQQRHDQDNPAHLRTSSVVRPMTGGSGHQTAKAVWHLTPGPLSTE